MEKDGGSENFITRGRNGNCMQPFNKMIDYFQRFQRLSINKMLETSVMEKDSLAFWRVRVLFSILFTALILCTFAVGAGIFLGIKENAWGLAISDGIGYLICIGLLFSKQIRYEIRAGVTLIMFYLVGVAVIVSVGPLSGGPAWLFAFAVLVGVLLGLRAAMGAVVLNAVTLTIAAWLMSTGRLGHDFPFFNTREAMVAAGINFIVLNVIAAMSVSALVKGLMIGHDKEKGLLRSLKKEKSSLLETKQKLEIEVEERKKAEEALWLSLEKYETIFRTAPVWVVLSSLDEGRYIEANEAFLEAMGYQQEEVIGKTSLELGTWVDSEDRRRLVAQVRETGGIRSVEVQRKTRSGTIIDTLFSAEILQLGDEEVMISMTQDISRYKKAEQERKRLQNEFLQAQKMESVGRLAGGVAHDFNNMLSVILGRTELALYGLNPGDQFHSDLKGIQKAATHAADITRQLLAFARKQTISPQVLDLNDTVEGMLKMLRRLIGEDVDLAWQPDTRLWTVNMDPSQIDQILVNLCVNARDAIEGVGSITIETQNVVLDQSYCTEHPGVVPGEYVMLAVGDDGSGMDQEILDNIFEPFYTTKALGKGTGLGLSTVYGIVKQNQGAIDVYSELTHGTTIQIYLPRHSGAEATHLEAAQTDMPQGRGETLLLVEDETSVLDVGKEILERLGYTVWIASGPAEAMEIIRHHSKELHLLVTDVVMPEMNGKELARQISERRPHIRTLFMSGYTADAVAHHGILEKNVNFIQKPFTVSGLAFKIREVLDQ